MNLSSDQRRLLLLCAIRVDKASIDWSLIARQAQCGGLDPLWRGEVLEHSTAASTARHLLERGLADVSALAARVDGEVLAAERVGARLTTVLDEDYPANLRLIPNLPPFLFYLGALQPNDARSVAVVGTRDATDAGVRRAQRLATELVAHDVTVTSGLAAGIDTAAHTAALDAGGRTIAVVGTGITKTYPAENRDLSARIVGAGAVVSQFWPTSSPATWTFPRRNVVMSGISQGTVVVEASATSGAKMQARLALEHGKKVFLMRTLVTEQEWAQNYIKRGAVEVGGVEDVVGRLAAPVRVQAASRQANQLSLELL